MDIDAGRNEVLAPFPANQNNMSDLYFHNSNNQNENNIKIEGIDMNDFK